MFEGLTVANKNCECQGTGWMSDQGPGRPRTAEEYWPCDKCNAEIRVTDPNTGGQKGSKLARFDLIPAKALWKVAELYGRGAQKYAEHNWRKGYAWSLSIAALERHLALFKEGEVNDSETGCPHLASVVFHALALLTFAEEHPELDDRFGGGHQP